MSNRNFTDYTANDFALFYRGKSYEALTANDKKRIERTLHLVATNYRKDGLDGCLAEIWSCTEDSNKMKENKQGRVDCYFLAYDENGNRCTKTAEVKTSGGRVHTYFNVGADGKPELKKHLPKGYVVYSLYSCKEYNKKQKDGTRKTYRYEYELSPRIMTVARFVQICTERNLLRVIAESKSGNPAQVAIMDKPSAVIDAFHNECEYDPCRIMWLDEIR